VPELLATVPELAAFIQDDVDETDGELYLRLASGEVRGATGLLFDPVTDDTVRLSGKGSRILLLPEAPVSDVTAVVENAGSATPTTLLLDVFDWDEHGVLERIDGGVFVRRRRFYSVTYDHGFAVVPDEVKAVVLRLAGRAITNPEGMRQESLGRYSYTLAGEQAGVGFYAPDLVDLEPYLLTKRMRAGTAAPTP